MDGNGAQGSGFFDLSSYYAPSSASVAPSVAVDHHYHHHHQQRRQQQPPPLTCLKLGKRPYYEGHGFIGTSSMKKERPMAASAAATTTTTTTTSSSSALAPRCQVDGCGKVLVDVKEYHRRHKVCEIHAKAPNVLVLGSEQRFCQQCSRFHAISEFDETKRSCRRRLAGHNERRRKSTSQDSILKNPTLESTLMGSRYPFISSAIQGRALSLLSSKSSPWVPTSDLSSRSSAALRELIAENRAAVLAKQLFLDRGASENTGMLLSHSSANEQEASQLSSCSWNQFQEGGSQVTLDLMQMPGTSFDIIPGRSKNKAEAEECCEIWKSLESTHVV